MTLTEFGYRSDAPRLERFHDSQTYPGAALHPSAASDSLGMRSMIFTTNKALTAWGRVLHDDDLAQAIIDRVLERGRLLPLEGPSMRTKHLGLDDPTSLEASRQLPDHRKAK